MMCMMIDRVASVDAPVLVVALTVGNWAVTKVDGRALGKLKADERKIAGVMHHTRVWR